MQPVLSASADNRRKVLVVGLAYGWIFAVILIFLWQTVTYRGLVGAVAEWQYDALGQSRPILTFILFVALFASPAVLVLRPRLRRALDLGRDPMRERLLARSSGLLRMLAMLATLFAAASLLVLLDLLTFPSATGAPTRVDVAVVDVATLPEGPAIVSGRMRLDRIATLKNSFFVRQHEFRFVPVQPPAASDSTLRFFVQGDVVFPPANRSEGYAGILRRNGLPGEIVRLYRDAGYTIASPNYVLYPSRAAMYWPSLLAAAQLALIALILLLAALLIRRWRTRVRARGEPAL